MKHYNALAFSWIAALLFLTPSLSFSEGGKKSCLKKDGQCKKRKASLSSEEPTQVKFSGRVSHCYYPPLGDEVGYAKENMDLLAAAAFGEDPSLGCTTHEELPEAMKAYHHHLSKDRILRKFKDIREIRPNVAVESHIHQELAYRKALALAAYDEKYEELLERAQSSGRLIWTHWSILEELEEWVHGINQLLGLSGDEAIRYESEAEKFTEIFSKINGSFQESDGGIDSADCSPISDFGISDDDV